MTAAFALLFVAGLFWIFYRQSFWALLIFLLISAVILGFLMYYIMLLFASSVAQPFILFAIGVILGAVLGRIICALCHGERFPSHKQTH